MNPPAATRIVRGAKPGRPALIAGRDIALIGSLAAALGCAVLLPQRLWARAAAWIAARRPAAALTHGERAAAHKFELRIQNWGAILGRWRPRIAVDGAPHVEAALAAHGGAVLWVVHAAFNSNVLKRAARRRGWPLHHLSRPEHGFSTTRFGMRVLNPLRRRAEDRDLAARIVIAGHDARAAVRQALGVLRARRGLVSITAGPWEGSKFYRVPFDEARDMLLPSGAPHLAASAGVPLLPAIVRRDGGDQDFTVVFGAPIGIAAGGDRDAAFAAAAAAFAAITAGFAAAHPDQWRGWSRLVARGTDGLAMTTRGQPPSPRNPA